MELIISRFTMNCKKFGADLRIKGGYHHRRVQIYPLYNQL